MENILRPKKTIPMIINDSQINVTKFFDEDYICLTDMARSAGSDRALHSWVRNKNTIEFLGLWEKLNNKDFKVHEYVYFKTNAGSNNFNPSIIEWIENTNARGIISKRGRYGGTYAHKDIAFEFGTWLSPSFKLLIITEFQKLKTLEQDLSKWDSHRYLSKINYKLHTDSIKNILIPKLKAVKNSQQFIYSDEADMLNLIVFGQTATDWRKENKEIVKAGKNQRDYATVDQLVILANLENLNAHFIVEGRPQRDRLQLLMNSAIQQYKSFIEQDIPEKENTLLPKITNLD